MKIIGKKDSYQINIENNTFSVRTNIDENEQRISWNVDRHCNAEYEVHIAIQGKCSITLNDESLFLNEGSFLIIAPGCYHSSKTISDKFEHFFFSFYDENSMLSKFFEQSNYFISNINNNIETYCLIYQNECDRKNFLYEDNKKYIINLIFIEILRQLNIENTTKNIVINDINPIDIIDQFFEQNHSHNKGEEMLANMLYISKRQLSRYLKQYYGLSYREKLLNARIEHAKRLLLNSNIDIANISKIVGYSSETSFYNMFNKQCGISPQQYRISERKKALNE